MFAGQKVRVQGLGSVGVSSGSSMPWSHGHKGYAASLIHSLGPLYYVGNSKPKAFQTWHQELRFTVWGGGFSKNALRIPDHGLLVYATTSTIRIIAAAGGFSLSGVLLPSASLIRGTEK